MGKDTNDNATKSAFPIMDWAQGLTKREYFAGLVLQGIIMGRNTVQESMEKDRVASAALDFADALLAELAKEK